MNKIKLQTKWQENLAALRLDLKYDSKTDSRKILCGGMKWTVLLGIGSSGGCIRNGMYYWELDPLADLYETALLGTVPVADLCEMDCTAGNWIQ
jgi:hypothetical protein